MSQMVERLLSPVIAPVLKHRTAIFIFLGAAMLQVGLTALGLPGWKCLIKMNLGIPCPGCGMSTALAFLVRGEWHAAVNAHLFAPVLVTTFGLAAIVSLLPDRLHRKVVRQIAEIERHTGLAVFLTVVFFIYWGLRLFRLL
ncbi:MAG: DUF2752 domain-containing protein [Deltaproteobacteria bacterium]|nr:DUF2752 domain-containing protein [Deltaproteobacteria bacterium]MBW2192309.1 DUF2752 domain-containing protein [Deltaproteobacteria bacterium]